MRKKQMRKMAQSPLDCGAFHNPRAWNGCDLFYLMECDNDGSGASLDIFHLKGCRCRTVLSRQELFIL